MSSVVGAYVWQPVRAWPLVLVVLGALNALALLAFPGTRHVVLHSDIYLGPENGLFWLLPAGATAAMTAALLLWTARGGLQVVHPLAALAPAYVAGIWVWHLPVWSGLSPLELLGVVALSPLLAGMFLVRELNFAFPFLWLLHAAILRFTLLRPTGASSSDAARFTNP